MTDALNVRNLGKAYPTYGSELTRFARWFGMPLKPKSEFWAVRDVSFDLPRGEAMAIIGHNGAGKSTLLKLITGTVRPTTGAVGVNGRVSAILELGLGFNPEFTGRENVRHSGGLLGLSPSEIESLMPEIESFAEIGAFFDQHLRVYSSGMQARLAFALATAIRPDILIVDEVLSVGDSYFQHKSFARIREYKESGTSILLVTHSMGDVRALCERVLLLDKGKLRKEGAPDEVVDYYNALIAEKENKLLSVEQRRSQGGWSVTKTGDNRVSLISMSIVDAKSGEPLNTVPVGARIRIESKLKVDSDVDRLVVGHLIRDRAGHHVWGTNTWHTKQVAENLPKGSTVGVSFEFDCNLGQGSYSVTYNLVSSDTRAIDNYESQDNFLVFDVINVSHPVFIGTTWLEPEIEVKVIENAG